MLCTTTLALAGQARLASGRPLGIDHYSGSLSTRADGRGLGRELACRARRRRLTRAPVGPERFRAAPTAADSNPANVAPDPGGGPDQIDDGVRAAVRRATMMI